MRTGKWLIAPAGAGGTGVPPVMDGWFDDGIIYCGKFYLLG